MTQAFHLPGTVTPWILRDDWPLWKKLFPLGTRETWQPKHVLYKYSDAADDIILITDGLLKIVAQGLNGNQRSIAVLGPGSVLGETALFSGKNYQHEISCVEAGSGVRFSKKVILESVIGKDGELTLYLMRNLAEKSYIMSSQLECVSFMSSEQLIALFLHHLYLEQVKDSWVYHKLSPLSLTTLAEMLGLHRVTLTRAVGELIKAEVISNVEHKLVVNNHEAIWDILRG